MQEKGSQKQELLGAAGRAFLQNASNALGPSDQTELFFFFFFFLHSQTPVIYWNQMHFFFRRNFQEGKAGYLAAIREVTVSL